MQEIIEKILKANNICIISHDGPDADAIGSSLALEDALLQLGKNAKYILQTNVNDNYRILLDRKRTLKQNENFDLLFVLDCSNFERINFDCTTLSNFIIVIDHHISDNNEGDICWREDVHSTGVLIYQLLKELEKTTNFKFNSYIATNLYMSIRGDTNNFKIINNNFDIHQMASELCKYNPDINLINEIEKYNISFIKLIGHVMNKLIFDPKTHIAYIIITKEELDLCNATFNDASYIIDLLKNIKEIKVIYLIIKNKNRLSIKARSEIINVGNIMSELGGGGHSSAAGISNFQCKDIYNFVDTLIKKTKRCLTE